MVITLLVISVVLLVTFVLLLTYLLGFRIGGQSWLAELHRVRAEAVTAERELHQLTRAAFVAMAERAERQQEQ